MKCTECGGQYKLSEAWAIPTAAEPLYFCSQSCAHTWLNAPDSFSKRFPGQPEG